MTKENKNAKTNGMTKFFTKSLVEAIPGGKPCYTDIMRFSDNCFTARLASAIERVNA